MREKVDRLGTELDAKGAELNANRAELNANRAELNANRDELDAYRAELDAERRSRLSLLVANALIDLARKLAANFARPESNDGHSTTRLQNFAANVNNNQLQNMGVPSKYWDPLRNIDEV